VPAARTPRHVGLQFYIFDGATYFASPDAGPALWDGSWHFAAGTYDGTTVRLYVDGVEVGDGVIADSPITYGLGTSDELWIGAYAGCSLGWDGDIDDVRVWDRALSADEIAEHAESCAP
jgi:hypothetical protein